MWNKGITVVCMLLAGAFVNAATFTEWSPAVSVESIPGTDSAINTEFQDGCPAPSRDGLMLFMASNRPGGQGGLDIWVARRESADDPWGAPVNPGPPINTIADEFCPTPLRNGRGLLFVSTKAGGCGGSDIYVAWRNVEFFPRRHLLLGDWRHLDRGWAMPLHLGCRVNSAGDEASPFLVEYDKGQTELYFSSTRAGGFSPDAPGAAVGDGDIYVSAVRPNGRVDAPVLVEGVNTSSNDLRPHLRRDGLELFFDSNRPGTLGGVDIWSAVREARTDAWSVPQNAGPNVNSTGNETRPFLSTGATTLYFGTTRTGVEGAGDIFLAKRLKESSGQVR